MKQAVVCGLETAFQKYSDQIAPFFGTLLDKTNKLEERHMSKIQKAIVVIIPDNEVIEKPINLSGRMDEDSFTHVFVLAGENSSVSLFEIKQSNLECNSHAVEIFAMENSFVNFSSIQNHSQKADHFCFSRSKLEKNAQVNWFTADFGSKLSKSSVVSFLDGSGSKTKIIGLFLGEKSQVFDLQSSAVHSSPGTQSLLLAKGVLDGQSKAACHGLIKTNENVQGAVGNQKIDSLLLSKDAESNPVPVLEIVGSDIKCGHSATTGRMNEEALFYLMSRGVDEKTARAMAIRGFFEQLLSRIGIPEVESACRKILRSRLKIDMEEQVMVVKQGGLL
jgi:Fe-S cluster assembly scaffold protein SufB